LILAGCAGGPDAAPPIGEAYAGPATLKLHVEVDPRSPEAAVVEHGTRLEILARRRRFFKVRTPSGRIGWTEERQLLSSADMDALNKLADEARGLPSQGKASVYEPLNVHTQPNRLAPSFYRIGEKEEVDVVAHELSPRVAFEPSDILPPPPPPKKRIKKPPEESSRRIPPPPPPAPPKPPENWLELSKLNPLPPEMMPPPPPPPKPVPVDDWSLVRLKNGRAGWVLFRMLRMDIPDEVAQYSEGARITSYFPMADIRDDDGQMKHQWLWTTISEERQPYEFDSFRYFIWNQRRHRYETAYIEKNLKGHYPVEVHPVKGVWEKKEQSFPGFSLLLEDANGALVRKTYAYEFYRVVLISTEPVAKPQSRTALTAAPPAAAQAAEQPGFFKRLMLRLAALRQRWTGR
jgi:hypothetical protein